MIPDDCGYIRSPPVLFVRRARRVDGRRPEGGGDRGKRRRSKKGATRVVLVPNVCTSPFYQRTIRLSLDGPISPPTQRVVMVQPRGLLCLVALNFPPSQASNPKKILLASRSRTGNLRLFPPIFTSPAHHYYSPHRAQTTNAKRTIKLGTYSVATTPFLQTSKWRISRRGCSVERSRDTADRSCAWRTPRGAFPPIPRPTTTTTTTTTTRAAAADAAVVIIIVRASSSAVPRTGPHGCGTCERGARRCA